MAVCSMTSALLTVTLVCGMVAWAALVDAGAASCPDGWTMNQEDKRCYSGYPTVVKAYSEAESACQAVGATVAAPKTQALNDFMNKLTHYTDSDYIWLPLSNIGRGAVWGDGERLADDTDGKMLGWNNFQKSLHSGDCTRMGYFGKWYRCPCSITLGPGARYICVRDSAGVVG